MALGDCTALRPRHPQPDRSSQAQPQRSHLPQTTPSRMLTSSPNLSSAPASPVASFQTLRKSPYHAARRRPSTTCAPPRPQVSSGPPQAQSQPQPSPVPSVAPSPRLTDSPRHATATRKYADAGTQYSPDGYPPTHRLHPPQPAPPAPIPQSSQPTAPIERRNTSTEITITDPPEQSLRVDPLPAVPAQNTQTRRVPSRGKEKPPARVQQTPRQNEPDAAPSEQSSPAKRPRPHSGTLKVMPLKYETCDVKSLGILISDMLMELVRLNDDMPLRDGQLTRFHSR